MKVLVDTSVWSLALRRKKAIPDNEKKILAHVAELINNSSIVIIGPIRQELLSGISDERQFTRLKEILGSFIDLDITTSDYEKAAEFFNRSRAKGIQGSHIDFLICAVASNNDIPVFTLDKDFTRYAQYCEFQIYKAYKPH